HLTKPQSSRPAVGKAFAVGRTGKREPIRVPHARAPKQIVERGRCTCLWARLAEDHRCSLRARDPSATRFPANNRKARSLRDARFGSSALPIGLAAKQRAPRQKPPKRPG